jgi:TRAP-type C4-dicarboxylate transport system permease small subunit
LYGIENTLLVGVLSAMILLAFGQIILRNFAGTGITWIDPLLRYLVLWVGMLGAMVATREDNHINIDIVSHILPERAKAAVRILTDIFTCTVCGFLTYASVVFIRDEIDMGITVFADIPSWVMVLILPLAFSVISLRYAIYTGIHTYGAISGNVEKTQEDGGQS